MGSKRNKDRLKRTSPPSTRQQALRNPEVLEPATARQEPLGLIDWPEPVAGPWEHDQWEDEPDVQEPSAALPSTPDRYSTEVAALVRPAVGPLDRAERRALAAEALEL